MSDWMDNFEMFGSKLNEGEKTLMRFATSREQRRIIQLANHWIDEFAIEGRDDYVALLDDFIRKIKTDGEIK